MTKQNDSQSKRSQRTRNDRTKKRFLKVESLEKRELLAGGVGIPVGSFPSPFTGPRNVGTVLAAPLFEAEGGTVTGRNDFISQAEFVPLGIGPGKQATIDISGSLPFLNQTTIPPITVTDFDTYAFDLRKGDILDVAALGAAGSIELSYANGTQWFGTDTPQALFYPADSPLQTTGNVNGAQVVPEDGRYYLTVAPFSTGGQYTLGLRVYRPIAEQLPIGTGQTVFLDFDGGAIPSTLFNPGLGPLPGIVRFPSIDESLPILGIEAGDINARNSFLDRVISEVDEHFNSVVRNGNNGDFQNTGTPGSYGVTILNSRDHADPGFSPFVTRVMVGGDSVTRPGLPANGASSTIDVGNFSMDDVVYVVLDGIAAEAQLFPISARESTLTATAVRLAVTISHEIGHSVGLRHTNNLNTVATIIDTGGSLIAVGQRLGVGPDGIFGTLDDRRIEFRDDQFDPAEGFFGTHRVPAILANTLVTGTVGQALSGRVFRDVNRNGVDNNEAGLGGVSVFGDLNNNGVRDVSEPLVVTGPDGSFTMTLPPGTFSIRVQTPTDFVATTPTVFNSGSGAIRFGFNQVVANITGTAFVDNDGDGIRDANDGGLAGAFIYVDLDGDNRPDLGEPNATTAANGTYSINFPGPGTYTVRVVPPAGFEQTFPAAAADFEHTVTFNGISAGDNFDFGFLSSSDYGDAPIRTARPSPVAVPATRLSRVCGWEPTSTVNWMVNLRPPQTVTTPTARSTTKTACN